MQQYLNYNGILKPQDTPLFDSQNRALRYGDAVYESLFATGREIPLLDAHTDRLLRAMKSLKMNIPKHFNTTGLKSEMARLLHQNRHYQGARLRLTVFRKAGGLYTPKSCDIDYIIESQPLQNSRFQLNEQGLLIDLYTDMFKTYSPISAFKTANALLFVLAGIDKQTRKLDDCLICTPKKHLVEGLSSNLFIYADSCVYTPPLHDACVDGVMRRKLIDLCREMNVCLFDDISLTDKHLLQAEEVFLSNAVSGIRWVKGFRDRRYLNRFSARLINLLNQALWP